MNPTSAPALTSFLDAEHALPTGAPALPNTGPMVLPNAPQGLAPRRSPGDPGGTERRSIAQLPGAEDAVAGLVRPYTFDHPMSGTHSQTLLAVDSPLWKGSDTRLMAHRIVLEAAQSHLSKRLAAQGQPPAPGSPLEKFVSGKLDHVYADNGQFSALAKASGRPGDWPVYVDAARNRLVVNIDQAFVANDELSPAAQRGLASSLGLKKNGLELLPRYQGHAIPSTTRGADFFKPNTHAQLRGEHPDASAFAHPHYFEVKDTKALGKEIVVHRGMFDNREGIPENSLGAINKAYEAGYRSLELDIEVTRDGVPVLLHDFTVGRMTNDPANRLVSHVDWDELRQKALVIRHPATGDFVETSEKVASVKDALLDIARTKPDMSIALDCKEQTAEPAFELLRQEPELRRFTALKLYAKAYPGGFEQFLGNLYARHHIDPTSAQDQPRRQELLALLKETKVEPVFSAGMVIDPVIHQLYPASKGVDPASAEGCAESALAWIRGWQGMDIKVIEAPPEKETGLVGQAMAIVRERLARPDSELSHLARSAAYRSEDFSVPQEDGSQRFFTNQIFGLMRDVTDDPDAARSETAGTLRHVGENVLTDQPQEEVYATLHDRPLARGHTGVVLDVPAGTTINTARNSENVDLRVKVFTAEKPGVDVERLAQVRAGLAADRAGAPPEHAAGERAAGTGIGAEVLEVGAGLLGLAAMGYAGTKLAPRLLQAATQREPRPSRD